MSLTIVGLGPGPAKLLTVEAAETLAAASRVYLRTSHHPTVPEVPGHLELISFDEIYEREPTFEAVYETIVARLEALAESEDVVYAVPGHPLFGEATVARLLATNSNVRIVAGLSYVEPACTLLGLDAMDSGLQLADALALPDLDPSRPALVAQVYNRQASSQLKLAALRWYPDSHVVTVLQDLALPTESSREMTLAELDREDQFDHLTSVYLPALAPTDNLRTLAGLRAINAVLRGPDGCPWDKEQTHQTLKPDLLEETYEVLAALDGDEPHHLAEEFGDLLYQVVFHAQVASEAGEYELEDVIEAIATKLIRRHPHVFGDVTVSGSAEVLKNWEAIKAAEDDGRPGPLLDRVPRTLPALHEASSVLSRTARAGFNWPRIEDVLEKLTEEVAELRAVTNAEDRADEFGDILFNLVNAGRYLGVDAEDALRQSTGKFRRRFAEVERLAGERGVDLHEVGVEGLLALWREARAISDEASDRPVSLEASTIENEVGTGKD